ncbi:TetR/AcrR family transcriptional regulator [Thermogemmatispora sp.]|uniref:TetR/AcrR family transcriptional regulator n=1 Tax=Thermogemmatispora sp. TaxID=1968838 RepID=UPI001E01D23A|nr:TetR/AcrR family transcriptional regulator [Thermogemmatispora sp.]MBX5451087.1 helix-turn-helix transcriptional regulator [Thermogemmatispora sp.]
MAERDPGDVRASGKERLIQATESLLRNRPFEEVTVEEITKEAKLSRPAFYYHFAGGKEQLRATLVERGLLRERPAQDTREQILAAALRAFARSGVSATTLDEIATEAGVSRGTLCWHFHSKEELLAALIRHYSPHGTLQSAISEAVRLAEEGQIDDRTAVYRIVAAFHDALMATPQGDLLRLAMLLIHSHPDAAQILASVLTENRKILINYVRTRQEQGRFRRTFAPELIVQILASIFVMRAVARGLLSLLSVTQFSREELIEQVVDLLFYGMLPCDQSERVS